MGYKVIIAEKPSVAKSIARIVGANTDHRTQANGWIEGNGYKVTWAFGHLVGIKRPEEMGFTGSTLPMIPERWEIAQVKVRGRDGTMKADPMAAKQLKIIKDLFSGCDSIIVATDAGREGELIFRYIYEYLGCTKPFERLWISSLTDEAIREGMRNLRPGRDYENLSSAAHQRSRADWLFGFNASKALRIYTGTANRVSLGRVQTPTLAMICQRFEENRDFKPTPYWVLEADTSKDGKAFTATGAKKYEKEDEAEGDLAKTRNAGSLRVMKVERKRTATRPPLLYDITAIQRAANGRYGYTAQQTLDILQKLYEMKLTTYPRTGSRYIPDDVMKTIPSLIEKSIINAPQFANYARSLKGAKLCTRSVDASKVTDHHALLPTGERPSGLDDSQAKIYDMITARMLEAFGPDSIADVTNASFDAGGVAYTAHGSVPIDLGWKAVMGGDATEDDRKKDDDAADQSLPELREGQILQIKEARKIEKQTKPKPIYTDSSILADMERCANLVDDEAAKTAMKDIGIGTPATRAETIEKLIRVLYIERKGKKLIPTTLGLDIYHMVKGREIADVKTTGIWEQKLGEVEAGKMDAEDFARGIEEQTMRAIDDIKRNCHAVDGGPAAAKCPLCGKEMVRSKYGWWCRPDKGGCGLSINWEFGGKKLPQGAIEKLLRNERTDVIKGLVGKSGKKYDAPLEIDPERKKIRPYFEQKDTSSQGQDTHAAKRPGPECPVCGHGTEDDGKVVSCPSCGLKVWKTICGHELTDKEVEDIFGGGRTAVLKLKSKEGKSFEAALSWDDGQKRIKFNFPPRKAYNG